MIRFRRNSFMAYMLMSILAIHFFAVLFYSHLLFEVNGKQFLLGCAILLLWLAVVVVDIVHYLIYCLDWIELRNEGVYVKHIRSNITVSWDIIKESELRQSVGTGWARAHPVHVVLSCVELPDAISKLLCTDFAPWLFNQVLIEFDLGRQEKAAEVSFLLGKNCELYSRAMEQYMGNGLSTASDERDFQLDFYKLLSYSRSARLYSGLKSVETFIWFLVALVSMNHLSQGDTLFESFTIGALAVASVVSVMLILWKTHIKTIVRKLG